MFGKRSKYTWQSLVLAAGFLISATVHADNNGATVHGFIDMDGMSSSGHPPEDQNSNGIGLGNIDLYLNPDINNNIKALAELVLEEDIHAGTLGYDAERAQLGFVINENNVLWMGRYHTPYGYWNTAFHHGAQLQTTINRPRFLDFEDHGGLLPTHSVGLWWNGKVKFSGSQFNYDVYAANGPRFIDGLVDFNFLKADNANAELGTRLSWESKSGAMEGFMVGMHAFSTKVNSYTGVMNAGPPNAQTPGVGPNGGQYGAPATSTASLAMVGGFIVYEGEHFGIDAEAFNLGVTNTTAGQSGSATDTMAFIEGELHFRTLHPFLMYESADLDPKDVMYMGQQGDAFTYNRTTIGLRYDVNTNACFKISYASTNSITPPNTWAVQQDMSTAVPGGYFDRAAFQFATRF